ncbi:hypothetical protein [uncultured Ferrimonas sp.]|uniref:hypothetical protein n=1 Tax=uncultured Ferrimonas sp. TaxID=432640 RepID=UPI00262D229E|nr:hypothetical protein [uncultured Ferrimonas sp.]
MTTPVSLWQQLQQQANNEPQLKLQRNRLSAALLALLLIAALSILWQLRRGFMGAEPSWVILPMQAHQGSSFVLLLSCLLMMAAQWFTFRAPALSKGMLVTAGICTVVFMQLQAKVLSELVLPSFVLWHYGAMIVLMLGGLLAWSRVLQNYWHRQINSGYRQLTLLQHYWQGMLLLWLLLSVLISLPLRHYQWLL